jgi:hypothetical protein
MLGLVHQGREAQIKNNQAGQSIMVPAMRDSLTSLISRPINTHVCVGSHCASSLVLVHSLVRFFIFGTFMPDFTTETESLLLVHYLVLGGSGEAQISNPIVRGIRVYSIT